MGWMACGAGAAECWLLTDDQLYVYDRNGQGPDANLGGSYVLPVSTDATFDASVGTLPYRYQNLYHKLRSAMLAGSSRESASRFLATLERAGVISQGRGRLTVHDPAALKNYVY